MTPISSVTAATQTAAKADSTAETEDRFLKLLVAQMRNQDPLNPLDNAQVTSQMAQLSTVSGINKLGELVQSLSSAFTQTQSLQATSMIGRGVLTDGSAIALSQGVAVGGFELASPADQVLVMVKDSAGNLVHSSNLGPQNAGISVFKWDGVRDDGSAAADGVYRFEIQASQNGKAVSTGTLSYGSVASVSLNGSEVQLNLLNLGAASLAQIKQVL
jgi:flagellar basal-body rod modification protein FlgD